jgi:2'-5' RNA ligase
VIEPEERPEINESIDLAFTVESIEVMESVLKRGGPQYSIIESHNLQ